MPKKAGIAIITLGAVLILSALLLLLYNRRQSDEAGQEAESLTAELELWMQEQGKGVVEYEAVICYEQETAADEAAAEPEMPSATISGYDCVGLIELPALELKLPVLDDWDYDRLNIAPCRQQGSSRTGDLVIAAHNYETHFGRLKELKVGDSVVFTDMDGVANGYLVAKIDTVDPGAVDLVLNSPFDLVLYTCTVGGQSRVAVFCNRAEEGA